MNTKKNEKMSLKLVPIDLKNKKELSWLHAFIHTHHSAPQFILPTIEEVANPAHRYFRAIVVSPRAQRSQFIGVSSYEERTHYLAETQKTILVPEFRGKGWGKLLSHEIEEEVRKAGFFKVRSCIYHTNLAMIQIKLQQGYIIEGFHPDHDGPGLHEYSLGKILVKK